MEQNKQALQQGIINLAKIILRLEWFWIALMIFAFWHVSPPIRDRYVFLLGFAIPIYIARYLVHRRLFTPTFIDIFLIAFVILTIFNFENAPLSRADYWVLVCRPLLGIFIIWYFGEHARTHFNLNYLIAATIGVGIVIGIVALSASQWFISEKSEDFAFIIDLLPRLNHREVLSDMQLSFNPNEIAGALAYFCPFLLAITLGDFRTYPSEPSSSISQRITLQVIRWGAPLGFILTFTALFLGQSRFALAGTFVALGLIILLILPTWKKRGIGLLIWGSFVIVETLLVIGVLPLDFTSTTQTMEGATPNTETTILNERDEHSLSTRFQLWDRAIQMMIDYPLTGAGMSTYRAMVTRDPYVIAVYESRGTNPPHAHNTFLQLGADFGIPGLILFVGWYGVIVWMAIRVYRTQNGMCQLMTIAIIGSILSYMGYGIGDAITLWDRFAFIHWWYLALMVSLFVYWKYHIYTNVEASNTLEY